MSNSTSPKLNWGNTIFLTILHIIGPFLIGIYLYHFGLSFSLVTLGLIFYFLTGLSITAGYHRLFAHKSYVAHPALEYFYLIFGAAAYQNSALNWCFDHRIHHRYVDQEDDPYTIKKGFWYAHIGWIIEASKEKNFPQYKRDLVRNPRVVWQDKYYLLISTLSSLVLPALIAGIWGEFLGGFIIAGVARLIIVHHATFFINSLCHMWGKQTYTDTNTAKDNFILALFTYGEGFHNFHHLFHNDYRNGIRWFHFDPTKWLIKFTSYFGLAQKLYKTPSRKIFLAKLEMRKKKIAQKESLSKLKSNWSDYIDSVIEKLDSTYGEWFDLKEQYKVAYSEFKKSKTKLAKANMQKLKIEANEAKLRYKHTYRYWRSYSRLLLRSQCV